MCAGWVPGAQVRNTLKMKILDQGQAYQADQITLERQGIRSAELMERAARGLFDWLHARLQGGPAPIAVFCGIGNNGGDGLALARLLSEHGYRVEVYIVAYSEKRSADFLLNLKALQNRGIHPGELQAGSAFPPLEPACTVVDALFGIGLSRPPDPWVRELIGHMNASGAFVLSVDLPSGLYMDAVPEHPEGVVRADCVLSIGSPKLVFFLPQTGVYAKQWEVLDIGLDAAYLAGVETEFELFTGQEARALYRPRMKFGHKGTYGHVRLVGGSYGKIGAVSLAARACLHSGAGLVTAWLPRCGYVPLQSSVPEAMVQTGGEADFLSEFPEAGEGYTTGLGMGMGKHPQTRDAFLSWLARQKDPLLIDADGLNLLSENPGALDSVPKGSILTPHPGELRRLIGPWKDDFDKLGKARDFASRLGCVLLIKGAHTVVWFQGKGFVNGSGNPGMATAGSGDALSGILTGLLAQGYPPLHAALLGVYLHGRAGDLMALQTGFEGLTASGIIGAIGPAFRELSQAARPGAGKGPV